MGLPYGEEIMIVGRTTSVTDIQTDVQTDRITMTKTAHRIASRGKNFTLCIIAITLPNVNKCS